MANSTTTTLASLISPIVQEAIFTASEQSIMMGLVRQFQVPAGTGNTARVPIYPAATAHSLTEGTDMAGTSADQAITTTTKDIAMTESGIMTVLSDMISDQSPQNIIAHLGRVFGGALGSKIDSDLMGLFTGFSTSMGGGAGVELTATHIASVVATLRANAAPTDNGVYYGVFHPYQIAPVKSALTNTFTGLTGGELSNAAMRNGYVGNLLGVQIFENSNISIDGSGDAIGAIFSKEALGLAMAHNMKVTSQYQASKRGTDVVATARYGVSELVDTYGVKVTSDAVL